MKKLSLFVEEEALNDVKFENLQSSLQFNNSSLNFEPIRVKTNIVDFECFGKHGLDNKIDYQFAINLLRNTKVFVKVEGFINDPKFKFNLQSDMKKVKEKWEERYKILAFYIEHDELEKVETELTRLEADLGVEEYKHCISELDTTIFISSSEVLRGYPRFTGLFHSLSSSRRATNKSYPPMPRCVSEEKYNVFPS